MLTVCRPTHRLCYVELRVASAIVYHFYPLYPTSSFPERLATLFKSSRLVQGDPVRPSYNSVRWLLFCFPRHCLLLTESADGGNSSCTNSQADNTAFDCGFDGLRHSLIHLFRACDTHDWRKKRRRIIRDSAREENKMTDETCCTHRRR